MIGLLALATGAEAAPLFYSSVNSNDIDYITQDDPSVYACTQYLGEHKREMVGKDYFDPELAGVNVFVMQFSDGTNVELWVHPDVGDAEAAAKEVVHFEGPLGKLPTLMREPLQRVVLNAGDDTPFSEAEGGFIILASQTMKARRAAADMEETVFHETAHVALDTSIGRMAEWAVAQRADDDFMTGYGQEFPVREDMAETALMVFTYFAHPERLGGVKAKMEEMIPNRLAFMRKATLPLFEPQFRQLRAAQSCDG